MVFPKEIFKFIPFFIKLLAMILKYFGDQDDEQEMAANGFGSMTKDPPPKPKKDPLGTQPAKKI